MIKKVLSLFLAVCMLCTCFISVSAAPAPGSITSLDQLHDLFDGRTVNVTGDIEVKTTGDYADAITARTSDRITAKATINMTNVIATVSAVKETLANPTLLDSQAVTGQFTITANWTNGAVNVLPATMETDTSLTGFTFTPSTGAYIFDEVVSRVKTGNELKIIVKVKDGITVADLANLPTEIALEYAGFGIVANAAFGGTIEGYTDIAGVGRVNYFFVDADNIAQVIQPATATIQVDGGGSSSSSSGTTKPKDEEKFELKYEVNGGKAIAKETYKKDQVVSLDKKVTSKDGYVFDGWYEDARFTKEITSVTITKNTTVYAKWVKERPPVPEMLNGVDHFAYVIGYLDGTVRPNNNITRAEVTTIFFRLLMDEVRDANLTDENIFDDVNAEDWHNKAISTMAKLGIVNGREVNMFAPDEFITRAEFTTICARFEEIEVEKTNNFTDIDEHWAKANILEAAAYGWIEGYEDKTFRPDEFITRAEAMTLINRILNRVHKNHESLLEDMATWSDNSDESAWYYTAVQEATNSNEYEHTNSVYKKWTKLMENRDWSEYQK